MKIPSRTPTQGILRPVDGTPRVAFFTDTFQEINGVALTSRQLTAFAERRQYPFLCVRGAPATRRFEEGTIAHLELCRGPLAFELDHGLRHDPALWRLAGYVLEMVEDFSPDIVHVVSPGDVSEIGVYVARKLNRPLAISWHTNLHEFGALRLNKMLRWMGEQTRKSVVDLSEAYILNILLAFYRMGDVLYAPNDELVDMLRERTGRPVLLMKRGIDTELFSPTRRTVPDSGDAESVLRLGYVGRITPEKNVRFLRDLEIGLMAAGVPPFRFLIVGEGSEREWLQQNLTAADLPGIQRGADLARQYANMDVFVFPSRTDTFGNVVLEAFASGVPAVVTDAGGPKFIVNREVTGFVAHTDSEFIEHTARLLNDHVLRRRMAEAAREQASLESWDSVFEKVYDGYRTGIARKAAVAAASSV
jgi:glycosyltransferase involved in cell wall biosynthesis